MVSRFADVLHVGVEPGGGFGLLVLGELLFEPGDAVGQIPVFASEEEVAADAGEETVDPARNLIRAGEQSGLGVARGVGVAADGHGFQHHEEHRHIDAPYELDQLSQGDSRLKMWIDP